MSTKKVNQPIGTIIIAKAQCGYYLSKKCPMNTSNPDPNGLGFWQSITPPFYAKGSLINYCKRYNIPIPVEYTMVKVSSLKKGELFRLNKPNSGIVWERGEYDKGSKKYSIYKYEDICSEKFIKGDKLVHADITY